jgi:Fungal trichothecene efflux pump (TRI12)
MPTRMFKNVGFVALIIVASIAAMVYYSLTILWPLILSEVYSAGIVEVGIQSAVVGGGVLLGQTCGGFALSYLPKVKWQTIFFTAAAASFIASLSSMDATSHARTIALGLLGCFTIGWVDNITFPGVTLIWEPQDIGAATGILGSIRALGGAVAQALYVTILTNKLTKYTPEYVSPAAVKAGLPESSLPALFAGLTTGNFSAVPGINTQIEGVVAEQVKRAYIDSFHVVFYATIPFGVLLVIAACFVPNMDKFLGNNVARRLQHMGKLDGEANEGQAVEDVEKQ